MADEPTALELRDALAEGRLTARQLADTYLARTDECEADIGAWTYLDGDHVRAQADILDNHRRSGKPVGPLHGLPVGLKDIIDTRGIATENGTVLDQGRQPKNDAIIVDALKNAGALIFGKTVTTELAYFHPGKTRNPHDTNRTPGGSSSGSAAAVAAGMVPWAIGSQTNGSVIRPAAFCGVVGFKPSRGAIPKKGVLTQSPTLDTLGVFARSVLDAALLADIVAISDPGDGTPPRPPLRLLDTAGAKPPLTPNIAFVRQPVWQAASDDTKSAFHELKEALDGHCDEVELPSIFSEGHAAHRRINMAEMAKCYAGYEARGRDQLSTRLQDALDEGKAVLARDYLAALDWIEVLNAGLEPIFERYDAIITPAAPGEPPSDLTVTGDPTFCTLWTLCGTPAVSLPLLRGSSDMPIGVQCVAARGDDARLLRTAKWLSDRLGSAGTSLKRRQDND